MSKRRQLFTEEKASTRPKLKRPLVKKTRVARQHLKTELKFRDGGVAYFGPGRQLLAGANYNDCSDSIYRLNLITEGTDRDNRIGRRVVIKKLAIRAWIFNDPFVGVEAPPPFHARMVVWVDKDGAVPANTAITNVYKTDDAPSTLINYNMLRNMEDSARYRVLAIKDFDYIAQFPDTANDNYPSARMAEADLVMDLAMTYPSSGTSPNDNLLMVSFITNRAQGLGAVNINPKIVFTSRVWFEDK